MTTITPPITPEPDGRDKPPARPGDMQPPATPPAKPRPAFDRGDATPGQPVKRNG